MSDFNKSLRVTALALVVGLLITLILGFAYLLNKAIPIINYEPSVVELSEELPEYTSTLRMIYTYDRPVKDYLFNNYTSGTLKYRLDIKMKNRNKEFTSLSMQFIDKDGFKIGSLYPAITYRKNTFQDESVRESKLIRLIDDDGNVTGYRFEGEDSYFSKNNYEKMINYSTYFTLQPIKFPIIN